ncbi:GNAT family N-acetyltransferase [Candidatus Bipolaricaulota bacterium]|nr:GNAT family N-acetyltransferase [Candidatus Bipolaricaulota bacterium]
MMDFQIRRAETKDRPRLLEISSQIWEGDDYIPDVVDAWIADPSGELAVAVETGQSGGTDLVVGFARCSRLAPHYAWLEGARTDPGHRNRGAGKALLDYFLSDLRSKDVRTVGLSTYIENKASIHIIERKGFRRVEEYVYAERTPNRETGGQSSTSERSRLGQEFPKVSSIGSKEALDFLGSLNGGVRFISDGWKFIPVRLGRNLVDARVQFSSVRRQGQLSGVAAISKHGSATGFLSIGLYGTDPETVTCLLDEAVLRFPIERSELMLWPSPVSDEILDVIRARGYSVWNEGRGDVYVYELGLAPSE